MQLFFDASIELTPNSHIAKTKNSGYWYYCRAFIDDIVLLTDFILFKSQEQLYLCRDISLYVIMVLDTKVPGVTLIFASSTPAMALKLTEQ